MKKKTLAALLGGLIWLIRLEARMIEAERQANVNNYWRLTRWYGKVAG